MGTKVHCTSYLPGFYTTMDLNENADGCWSHYYGDKTSSGNSCNIYQLRPSNGYSEYDKEMLKRTMLEHEAIFRKQVYELHRLYRRQKDMMNELKKGPKRMFDLQLPADVYIDCEEAERSEKEIVDASSSITNNAKVGIGMVEGPNCREETMMSNIHGQADLNEHAKEICFGGGVGSDSAKFLDPKTPLLLPMRSNTNFSGTPSTFLKGRRWDEGTSSNHLHADYDETGQEWSFFNKQVGQMTSGGKLSSLGSFREGIFTPSARIQLNEKPHDILSLDQNKRDLHYGQMTMPFPNRSSDALLDHTSASSLLLSSWTKPTNGYSQDHSRDLSSHSRVRVNPPYCQNCYNQTPLNGFHNGRTTQKNNGSVIPPCKSYMMELDLSQGYPQLKMNPRYERRQEIEKNVNLFNLQDLPSSSHAEETTMEMDVASCGQTSKKIFGFCIPEKTQQSVATEHKDKDKSRMTLEDPGAKSFRNHIDLNIDLNSSDLSAEREMPEAPLQQASTLPVAPKIDLEAPIVLEEGNADDDLIREAAESILSISSDKLPPVPYTTLRWFADVVSSGVEDEKENSDYTLDSFELMTLNLEETRPEEYSCPSGQGQNQKDNDDDGKNKIASLLFTKPRRGHARKRRKRDFQKDILPGLASLSRHEVMEDLQTIGGGTMRRNSTRDGTNCRGRKPRSLAITTEMIHVTPPLEVEIDGKSMVGWGRTTRRCRRQRFAPFTNVAAPLT